MTKKQSNRWIIILVSVVLFVSIFTFVIPLIYLNSCYVLSFSDSEARNYLKKEYGEDFKINSVISHSIFSKDLSVSPIDNEEIVFWVAKSSVIFPNGFFLISSGLKYYNNYKDAARVYYLDKYINNNKTNLERYEDESSQADFDVDYYLPYMSYSDISNVEKELNRIYEYCKQQPGYHLSEKVSPGIYISYRNLPDNIGFQYISLDGDTQVKVGSSTVAEDIKHAYLKYAIFYWVELEQVPQKDIDNFFETRQSGWNYDSGIVINQSEKIE